MERLTQGASGTPVDRRECLTILLGTYAENTNHRHGRRTALYSVQPACAYIGSRLCRDTRSTIALEKRYTLPLHLLEVLFVMYF